MPSGDTEAVEMMTWRAMGRRRLAPPFEEIGELEP